MTVLVTHGYHDLESNGDIPGKWVLSAFVQGQEVRLLVGDVYSGKTIKLKPGTELTVKLPDNTSLSLFTIGVKFDWDALLDFLTHPIPGFHSRGDWSKEIIDIFRRFY